MPSSNPSDAADSDAADSDAAENEVVLADDPHRRVVRIGNTIRRPLESWSASVHTLLDHLQNKGFPAPTYLGVDASGRETLSAIDGVSGADGWAQVVPEDGLRATARLLRRYHQAVADFSFADLTWASPDGPAVEGAVLCHGDFGPWNLVWREGEPVGVIDWDYAWPQPPLHDVCSPSSTWRPSGTTPNVGAGCAIPSRRTGDGGC